MGLHYDKHFEGSIYSTYIGAFRLAPSAYKQLKCYNFIGSSWSQCFEVVD
ncbi:hypothetical protein SAMD00023353_0502580 [Rosellinia necatrix]|uniref:Uncharacterized protein n=1 Tax=Rosellinia necatrix TaxID=77044 RepID=A0A1S8A5Q1_ROSNE|nr:hypothetical protein SAMD00023353_0502580 [Rosellinia necatrix]